MDIDNNTLIILGLIIIACFYAFMGDNQVVFTVVGGLAGYLAKSYGAESSAGIS